MQKARLAKIILLVGLCCFRVTDVYALAITNDIKSGVANVKNWMNDIKETKIVKDTIDFTQKTGAAIGDAKKSLTEFVTSSKEKIEAQIKKVNEYKEKVEEYKKEYEEYKKEYEEYKAEFEKTVDDVKDGIEEAKDTVTDGVQQAKSAIDAGKQLAGSLGDIAQDKINDVASQAGIDLGGNSDGATVSSAESGTSSNTSSSTSLNLSNSGVSGGVSVANGRVLSTSNVANSGISSGLSVSKSGSSSVLSNTDSGTSDTLPNVISPTANPTSTRQSFTSSAQKVQNPLSQAEDIASFEENEESKDGVKKPESSLNLNPISEPKTQQNNFAATAAEIEEESVASAQETTDAKSLEKILPTTQNFSTNQQEVQTTATAPSLMPVPSNTSGMTKALPNMPTNTETINSTRKSFTINKASKVKTLNSAPATIQKKESLSFLKPEMATTQLRGYASVETKSPMAFALLSSLEDNCTDVNNIFYAPKGICMKCGLSSAKVQQEGVLDQCLVSINDESKEAIGNTFRNPQQLYDDGLREYAAVYIVEGYKARNDVEAMIDEVLPSIETATTDNTKDLYAQIVETNKAVVTTISSLTKLYSAKLMFEAYKNYDLSYYDFSTPKEE